MNYRSEVPKASYLKSHVHQTWFFRMKHLQPLPIFIDLDSFPFAENFKVHTGLVNKERYLFSAALSIVPDVWGLVVRNKLNPTNQGPNDQVTFTKTGVFTILNYVDFTPISRRFIGWSDPPKISFQWCKYSGVGRWSFSSSSVPDHWDTTPCLSQVCTPSRMLA